MKPLKRLYEKLFARPLPANKRCVLCGCAVQDFYPYEGGWSAAPRLMRLLDVVGSDLDHWACPNCGAHDRERHLLLYMERTALMGKVQDARVLHFAPEKRLVKQLLRRGASEYVQADLYPSAPDVRKIDMLNMDLADSSFDIVIANHVLEHVSDDRRALREVHRVLRPGGFAILQTPYSAKLFHTIEDPGVDSAEARIELYGQDDHVRLFGRDIIERFASVGLRSDIHWHHETLADIDAATYGVNAAEPLFLFHRT